MKRLLFVFIIFWWIFLGCQRHSNQSFNYYNSYFDFNNDSSKIIIYTFFPQGCASCNKSFIADIKDKQISENEYFLLVSRYPYCESQRETTLLVKEKFKKRFAIDSTDNYLKYNDIKTYSDTVVIRQIRVPTLP